MEYTILPAEKVHQSKNGVIFCGYLNKNPRNGVERKPELSRCHKQPNRIHSIKGVHPTISSTESAGRYYIYTGDKVRKLTEKECFRLMGVVNSDIDKLLESGFSKAQLLKLAGNSIVVDVLYNIFRTLFVKEESNL